MFDYFLQTILRKFKIVIITTVTIILDITIVVTQIMDIDIFIIYGNTLLSMPDTVVENRYNRRLLHK